MLFGKCTVNSYHSLDFYRRRNWDSGKLSAQVYIVIKWCSWNVNLGVLILTRILCLPDQAALHFGGWGTGRGEMVVVVEEKEEDTVHLSSQMLLRIRIMGLWCQE